MDAVRTSSQAVWSSAYLPAGADLASAMLPLFVVRKGGSGPHGRIFDLVDTNMREAGRLPLVYDCQEVRWTVAALAGETDVEKLAYSSGYPMVDQIRQHSSLFWDFDQTWMDISPLWAGESVQQHIRIPQHQTWKILLSFGKDAPTLTMPHVVRVLLLGQYASRLDFG